MNKSNKKRLTTKNSIKPIDFIDRFCNKLSITDEELIDEIKEVCNIAIRNNIITENTPPSIASGSIYFYIKNKEKQILIEKIFPMFVKYQKSQSINVLKN